MRARLGDILFTVAIGIAAVCLGFLSTRHGFEYDLSAGARASLGPATTALLETLDAPVEVVSYARRQGGLRPVIGEFVARYQRLKPDLTLRFVDPDADPGAMRAEGIRLDGEIEIRYRERSERLKVLSENEFSNALLRLSRSGERIVAFLEGAGERQPLGQANADLGQFVLALQEQGMRPVGLPLASSGQVPRNTDLLVIANPRVALPPAAVTELIDYVERGGNLLWLAEPDERGGLDALAEALSLRVLPGTVVDGGGAAFGLDDPTFVAVSQYPPHAITQGFVLTTLFPQAVALAQVSPPRWDIAPLLRSSLQSWNETGHIPQAGEAAGNVRHDAEAGEITGPLDLGFALRRNSPDPERSEQRVVVIGDGDFLSNTFLGNAGNREFGVRLFNWLVHDDSLVEVPDRSAPDRELTLSQTTLNLLGFAFLVGLPALLAACGGVIAWRRRRR